LEQLVRELEKTWSEKAESQIREAKSQAASDASQRLKDLEETWKSRVDAGVEEARASERAASEKKLAELEEQWRIDLERRLAEDRAQLQAEHRQSLANSQERWQQESAARLQEALARRAQETQEALARAKASAERETERRLSEMGGLYRTMPLTLGLYMVGGFAISAVPLFSGFVSKSMVVSAAGESHRAAVFLMLTLASAGTFLHTGLKLPYSMFFGPRPAEPPGPDERRGAEPPANLVIEDLDRTADCHNWHARRNRNSR